MKDELELKIDKNLNKELTNAQLVFAYYLTDLINKSIDVYKDLILEEITDKNILDIINKLTIILDKVCTKEV